ncbi:MAG: DEAD/DEAH box helicase [Phycisphaeraceae bacterium]
MSLVASWSPFFQSQVRMEGRALQLAGKVRRVPAENGELVRAIVETDDDSYTVTIHREDDAAIIRCDSPAFEAGSFDPCVWATVLTLEQEAKQREEGGDADAKAEGGGGAEGDGDSEEASPSSGEGIAPGPVDVEALSQLRLKPPKARKRAARVSADTSAKATRREPDWVGRLSLLSPAMIEVDAASSGGEADLRDVFPVQRQVCYVLRPDLCRRHAGLVVELQQRTALASGWSKPKRLRLTASTLRDLPDPHDRELCGMIVGASPVSDDTGGYGGGMFGRGERSHATFRLPVGSRLTLLKRVIATRRCFLADDEGTPVSKPIQWGGDPPWTLWLVGSESPDATELILSLELRRRGRRVGVEQPDIVLGGNDGLMVHDGAAAPFDDRDAFRWVGQFREDTHGEVEARPIHVPMADAPRLLERLYMLPALPEIDLPEGMGREELRVEPTPHLDLFASGSAVAQEASASKGQLAAQVWFAYARQRVDAGQPGRFIAMPCEDAAGSEGVPAGSRADAEGEGDAGDGGEAGEESQTIDAAGEAGVDADSEIASASGSGGGSEGGFETASQAGVETQAEGDAAAGAATSESIRDSDGDTKPAADLPADADVAGSDAESALEEARQLAIEASDGSASAGMAEPESRGDGGVLVRREHRFEREAIELLASLGLRQPATAGGNTLLVPAREVPRVVSELLGRGWEVSADRAAVRSGRPPRLSVASGVDWFELRGSVAFERTDGTTQEIPLPEILAAARTGRHMVTLDDGSQGLLPEQWLESHKMLAAMGKLEDDHIRFAKPQVAFLDALLEEKELERADDAFLDARERLHRFDGLQPAEAPEHFHGSLRTYQKVGVGWMDMLRQLGMGGVLADDMGLGKTIQVLAALLRRREERSRQQQTRSTGKSRGYRNGNGQPKPGSGNTVAAPHAAPPAAESEALRPSLIVVPRSVVFNWIDEAEKFTPDLRVAAYTGPERGEVRKRFDELDVIVTSYGLLRRDIDQLRDFTFDYVVLDEAQAIKNPQSQAAKACRLLMADHRLALTGTPIENHLGDLWSIFEFLNPGMLGSGSRFSELVRSANQAASQRRAEARPIAPAPAAKDAPPPAVAPESTAPNPKENADAEAESTQLTAPAPSADPVAQLARAVRPFIFRRTKSQVLSDLPAKTEQTVLCEMNDDQRKIYDDLRDYYRNSLLQKVESIDADTSGGGKLSLGGGSAFMVLEALLRLRQAACHPGLINDAHAASSSAKLEALEAMLDDIIEEGAKALVFSQFTTMLGLVRQRLDQRGIRYAYLDGQTRNRKQIVESFQNDPELPVFLISLKAGGLGLNLTAAEYVFLLDPWWNPAVEAQAIDRTHRIGQTKPVFAYRLICEDTVEQRVLELQKAKRELAEAVVTADENMLRTLTKGELEKLLS